MKPFRVLSLILLFPIIGFCQNTQVEQSSNIVEKSLELYDKYFAEGKYKEAGQYAHNAFEEAGKLGDVETQAIALNRRGKALVKIPNAKNAVLNRAAKSFEESNYLTSDKVLKLENLGHMLTLAKRMKKRREVAKLKAEIAVLKGDNFISAAEEKADGILNRRKKAMEEFQKVQDEKEELAESLSELSEEQKIMQQQQSQLVNMIAQKETAIQVMTEEQIKQELILSEQDRLLDSMLFSSILDSLELSQSAMLLEQQESEILKQQVELKLRNSQRNLFMVIAAAFLLICAGVFHRYYSMRQHNAVLAEKNKIIEAERERSENLLLNILPAAIADELKVKGVASTQLYKKATVMFVDFKGFSRIAQQLSAKQLVAELDHAFKHFDGIIERHGLEKIKTIGDEYMCAGGLPTESEIHAKQMVNAALEIQDFLAKWNSEKKKKKQPVFEARIGIHTGPLIAGVVGSKKFAYDVWGDTVNVASRMESKSEAGKVNISSTTFSYIKNDFVCEYRGKVPAKNVGEVEMYYVSAPAA